MNKNLSIVRGNDFTLTAPVKQIVFSRDEFGRSIRGEKDVPLAGCFLLSVNLIGEDEEALPLHFDTDGSNLIIKIGASLECGWYGIEVKFRKGGMQYRSYEKKVFKIVENNGSSSLSGEMFEGEQSYMIDTMWCLGTDYADDGKSEGESIVFPESAGTPSTSVFVPTGKKIMVCGASLAGENNGWTQLVEHLTGIPVINQAVGNSDIMRNMAARLMYRSFTLNGVAKTLHHGLLFSDISIGSINDIFDTIGCVIIDHVHNKDVFTLQDRPSGNPSEWTAEEYEAYFKVVDNNGQDAATLFYDNNTSGAQSITRLSRGYRGEEVASWRPVPNGASDTNAMTYAEAFDYVIKRIKSWCNETLPGTEFPKNTVEILICSHWTQGRTTYNTTSRLLAMKHGLGYCEMDKKLGFVKGDDVNGYNRSVLHSWFPNGGTSGRIDTGADEGEKDYWGWHPICMSDEVDYGYGKVTVVQAGVTKEVYMPWIQLAIAHAVVDCLKYNPVEVIEH